MKQKVALLICVLLMISCEKDKVEPITFLTQGIWVLKSEIPSFSNETPTKNRETFRFSTDGTFVNEWYLDSVILPYVAADGTKVKLSGKWNIKDHDLTFMNENLSIPKANGQDSIVNNIKFITQSESFSKSILNRWGHNSSANNTINYTIEIKIGNEFYMGNPNVVIPDTTGGIITELTEDKLAVWSFNNRTRTYSNE